MLQRSEEWHEKRRGRFTASNIINILGKDGLKKTNDAIKNMALNKAIEEVFGVDQEDRFVSFDMQRGIDLEPMAFECFKNLKSLDFIDVENCSFFEYGKNAGASPDGIVSGDSCLEIKCPKKNNFFEVVISNEIDPKYYAQMQMQMLCTGSIQCYYFNYIVLNSQEHYHEIVVERDEKYIELIKERILIASELKNQFIKKIKK